MNSDLAGSALTFYLEFMNSLSINVAETVQTETDQSIKFIDSVVEKLETSWEILSERMKMKREGWKNE